MTKEEQRKAYAIINKSGALNKADKQFIKDNLKHCDRLKIVAAANCSKSLYDRYMSDSIKESFLKDYVKAIFKLRVEQRLEEIKKLSQIEL